GLQSEGDDVGRHPVLPGLGGQVPDEALDAALAGRVHRDVDVLAGAGRAGGDLHDPAPAVVAHPVDDGFDAVQRAVDVEVDRRRPLLGFQFAERLADPVLGDAGIVDQYVHVPAEFG